MSFFPPCGRISRRNLLVDCGMGFAGLALTAMLRRDGLLNAAEAPSVETWRPPDGKPHFAPKAKNVIWLFMLGGTSHLESFDPKPALNRYAGLTISESPYGRAILESPYYRRNVRDFAGTPRNLMPKLMPLQVGYSRRGQ